MVVWWSNRLQLRRINKNRLHTLLTLHFIFLKEREEHTHITNLLKYTVRSIINLTSRSSPPRTAKSPFFLVRHRQQSLIVGKQTTNMTKKQICVVVILLDYYREPVSQAKLSKVNKINSGGGGWWVHVEKI